ncbi:thioredoxin family protein [Melaminivora alkalimesophila]|uniref:thioredoxin family protein n=1 Tax=Melaminivora alkalimesophila TaxID=1165852 RepID=UPI0006852BFF|nr:thioredoxin family protein [Melaminivora alkalimesophila]
MRATGRGGAQGAAEAGAVGAGWWLVCLCAQWCGVCREFRPAFEALAREGLRLEWVDVEDDEDLVGELDIETFPTVLIAEGSRVRFFGTIVPQAGVLTRLLESLRATAGHAAAPDAGAQALLERIMASR